jgi:hypothetical protein
VQDVKEAVEAEEEDDVRCDVLDILASRDHIELGQDRPCLQPD